MSDKNPLRKQVARFEPRFRHAIGETLAVQTPDLSRVLVVIQTASTLSNAIVTSAELGIIAVTPCLVFPLK